MSVVDCRASSCSGSVVWEHSATSGEYGFMPDPWAQRWLAALDT